MNNKFNPGDRVYVVRQNDDLFNYNFAGTVKGYRYGYVQVVDQAGEVWEVSEWQVSLDVLN